MNDLYEMATPVDTTLVSAMGRTLCFREIVYGISLKVVHRSNSAIVPGSADRDIDDSHAR
jgi:hypothetical protein